MIMTEELQFIEIFKDERSISYMIKTSNKDVGTIEGYVSNEIFYSVIHINTEFQKKGIGFYAFQKVFKELSLSNTINKIAGSWHEDEEFTYCNEGKSTNLDIFLKNIKCNMSKEESALNTPTGKWAFKLGFTSYIIVKQTADSVLIHFTKPK